MVPKDLKSITGLNRVLEPQGIKTQFCSFCNKQTGFETLILPWKSSFEDAETHAGFRQNYEILRCENGHTKFVINTWCDELDEIDFQELDVGAVAENNLDRKPDGIQTFPSDPTSIEKLLLDELTRAFGKQIKPFLLELYDAKSIGLFTLSAIGIRSLIEQFFERVGTTNKRDKFTSETAKKMTGTSKKKNDYLFKLLWLEENGLITKPQSSTLLEIVKVGNKAAHQIISPDEILLDEALKTILALTIQFQQLKHG